jgi:hypothetical protein
MKKKMTFIRQLIDSSIALQERVYTLENALHDAHTRELERKLTQKPMPTGWGEANFNRLLFHAQRVVQACDEGHGVGGDGGASTPGHSHSNALPLAISGLREAIKAIKEQL